MGEIVGVGDSFLGWMEHVMEMMEMGFGGEMQRKILHETKEVSKPVRRGFVSTLIHCSFSCRKIEVGTGEPKHKFPLFGP